MLCSNTLKNNFRRYTSQILVSSIQYFTKINKVSSLYYVSGSNTTLPPDKRSFVFSFYYWHYITLFYMAEKNKIIWLLVGTHLLLSSSVFCNQGTQQVQLFQHQTKLQSKQSCSWLFLRVSAETKYRLHILPSKLCWFT